MRHFLVVGIDTQDVEQTCSLPLSVTRSVNALIHALASVALAFDSRLFWTEEF